MHASRTCNATCLGSRSSSEKFKALMLAWASTTWALTRISTCAVQTRLDSDSRFLLFRALHGSTDLVEIENQHGDGHQPDANAEVDRWGIAKDRPREKRRYVHRRSGDEELDDIVEPLHDLGKQKTHGGIGHNERHNVSVVALEREQRLARTMVAENVCCQINHTTYGVEPDIGDVDAVILAQHLQEPLVVHTGTSTNPAMYRHQHTTHGVNVHLPRAGEEGLRGHACQHGSGEEHQQREPLPKSQRLSEHEPPDKARGQDFPLHQDVLGGWIHVQVVQHVQVVVQGV
mmetsp:Transcript_69964/g.177568  ORF Transcript_69964/g.177568 Transcript_69964/m.177568 type:complete len:288 (-) Transcript_69964:417-1280(-)